MTRPLRWGIIGTGRIGDAMVEALTERGHSVVVVGSRSTGRAADFVRRNHLDAEAGSVADVAAAGPDAVYVASSNHNHLDDALACLEAGVAVLCEKPLTPDLESSRRMVTAARASGVFLMEAMWMRFLPMWGLLEEQLASGRIGEIRTIAADFGIPADPDPSRRWFDPGQAGGSLLDVGIYPVTFAYLLAGAPTRIRHVSTRADTGVDAQYVIALEHGGGVVSRLGSSFVSDTDLTATVAGPGGRLHLRAPFHHSPRLEHWVRDELVEAWDTTFPGSGYAFEVAEVERCLAEGLIESTVHPLDATLAVMGILDDLRR